MPEAASDGGVPVNTRGGEAHVLGVDGPVEASADVKIVWRVTGDGEITLTAISPTGRRIEPTQGPTHHTGSSFKRPGDEWGSVFVFDEAGCWEIEVRRGEVIGALPISVV
jgi:hypothetical protein